MNVRSLAAGAAGIVVIFGVLAALLQREQIQSLRATASVLEAAARPVSTPAPPAPSAPVLPAAATVRESGPVLTENEKLELLRLRGKISGLRQREKDLAKVKSENEVLRGRVAVFQPGTPGAANSLPVGYVRRRDARAVGLGTPESTLETLFWALEHRDKDQLFEVFDERSTAFLRSRMESEGVDKLWEEVGRLPGYRLAGAERKSDTEVILKVELMPGEPPADFHAHKSGAEWKLSQ